MSTHPDAATLAALGLSLDALGVPQQLNLPEVAEGRVDVTAALTLAAALEGASYLGHEQLDAVLAVAHDRAHLIVGAADLRAASPPEAVAQIDGEHALIHGPATLLVDTPDGPVVVAWTPERGARLWPVASGVDLPDIDLPPALGHIDVPPVTASLLGGHETSAELTAWLDANGALPSGLHRLAAVGHLARYWVPTSAAARRAALEAVFAGGKPPGVAAIRGWAASVDAEALDGLETLADALANNALARTEELAALSAELGDDDAHDDAVAELCADRELLAGLLLALGTLGRGRGAAAAVAQLDAAVTPELRAVASLTAPLSAFEAERSDAFEDDAWWAAG